MDRTPRLPVDPSSRTFAVVTTCHAAGYDAYGRRMVESYLRHWPVNVPLLLYAEGFAAEPAAERLVVHDLAASSPELMAFKERHRHRPLAHGRDSRLRFHPKVFFRRSVHWLHVRLLRRLKGFRWDAVRFAHKTFAIFHAARNTNADVLIWIDADTRFFADVTPHMLESFVPPDRYAGFLWRERHSECGFVAYNLRHPAITQFLAEFEAMYTQDLLFAEHEFHDSYLFDIVRKRMERRGHHAHDIAGGAGRRASHVLINCPLGAFMDHLKGPEKKAAGTSSASDLVAPRDEVYWTQRT